MGRILLIDDDDMGRGYVCTLLKRAGHEVVEASNGPLAIRVFREAGIDLVITDIYMPGMSGLEALLEMDPQATRIPVIAITGGGLGTGVDPLALARTLGASMVFLKPFHVPSFLLAVTGLLADAGKGRKILKGDTGRLLPEDVA